MSLQASAVWLARGLAVAGGIVLVAITLITVASIGGRAIGTFAHADTPDYLMFMDGALQWLRDGAGWLVDQKFRVGSWNFRIGNVPGDFELVEAGVGFAVFAFLPWCQLTRGHASVDIFTNFLPPGANRAIDVVSELLMTVVITLFAWRLWYGMHDKLRYNETTFILQFPLWWAYAACMVAAAIGVAVSFVVLIDRIGAAAAGRSAPGQGRGAPH